MRRTSSCSKRIMDIPSLARRKTGDSGEILTRKLQRMRNKKMRRR